MRLSISWRHVRVAIALTLLLLLPRTGSAHPLDEYWQVTDLTVGREEIVVSMTLSPGVLVAPGLVTQIDTDGDGHVSPPEQQSYARLVLAEVVLSAGDQPLPLTLRSVDVPPVLMLQSGAGSIEVVAYAPMPEAEGSLPTLHFVNQHEPLPSTYQVSAMTEAHAEVAWMPASARDKSAAGAQAEFSIARLQHDPLQRGVTIELTRHGGAVQAAPTIPRRAESSSQERLVAYLTTGETSRWFWLAATGVAALLGALHALTPGHGKALIAAYLVGSQGTVRQAVALGGIVTFTHTASVIVIGLAVLLASQSLMPSLLVPLLELGAGLLVVFLGLRLLWQRWHEYRHHADGHHHHHEVPQKVTMRSLWALGVSGGMVPCPEALGLLLVAIGLNKSALGLVMIVAFSLGLAGTLIALGITLVRTNAVLAGRAAGQHRWARLIPLASSVIVTALGTAITVKALQSAAFSSLQGAAVIGASAVLTLGYLWMTRGPAEHTHDHPHPHDVAISDP